MKDGIAAKRKRSLLIEMASRRQRPGSGSSVLFLRERTCRMLFPDLSDTLSPCLWAIVGAAAVRMHMPERATNDLDILVSQEESALVRQKLRASGANFTGELSIGGSSWVLPDGFPLDVIECSEAWRHEALAEARTNRDLQGLPALPLPYLVLMKFQAGRLQDIADISRMLGQASEEQLEKVREIFRRCEPEGIEDLESLIVLGQLEQ